MGDGVRDLAQYDTDSRNVTWQSRARWIVEPGQDLFLLAVYGWNRTDDGSIVPTTQDVTVKFVYTVRF